MARSVGRDAIAALDAVLGRAPLRAAGRTGVRAQCARTPAAPEERPRAGTKLLAAAAVESASRASSEAGRFKLQGGVYA